MTAGRVLRTLVGLAIGAAFLWLVLSRIDVDEARLALADARPGWIALAVVAFLVGYACRIERWRLMLTSARPGLTWSACAGPMFASVAANNVLPFRAGDLLRAFGFNRRLGIDAATSLTTLFAERILDLLMILSCLGIALLAFGETAPLGGGLGAALVVGGCLAGLSLVLAPGPVGGCALRVALHVERRIPAAGTRLSDWIRKAIDTLRYVSGPRTLWRLVFWSACAWIAEGVVFWCCAIALPSIASPAGAWLALPIGTLSTVLPGTPGYVGTFDFFVTQSMTAHGNTLVASTVYAFIVHLVLWLPPTLAGALYLLARPVQRADFSRVHTA